MRAGFMARGCRQLKRHGPHQPLTVSLSFPVGCFPFIIAFACKWNMITFITGCSHEKLQVYHQWMSHLFLFLSLV